MSRLFYHVMQDNSGNLLFDVSGTMRLAGSGTLATIYGDEALTVILPNPMTNHPSFASFKCFLGAGNYDFYLAKAGYTFETLTGVQGHGTMAQQDASAVAITGGSATLSTLTTTGAVGLGRAIDGAYGLSVQGAIQTAGALLVSTQSTLTGQVGIGRTPDAAYGLSVEGALQTSGALRVGTTTILTGNVSLPHVPGVSGRMTLTYDKSVGNGITFQQQGTNTGGGGHCGFQNMAGTIVGEITSNATTTTYATTSDARLKDDVQALDGALELLAALMPVRFRWKVDGSAGVGFVAQEVQPLVPEAVTGTADAVDDAGQIVPMGIDVSKLVPYLTAALQALTARVASLEQQLGGETGAASGGLTGASAATL